ncbi:hypothetical protein MMAGJ_58420 [Mycolicibacterium mageritense]|uniref:Uncharacterized protein n=1 Tax=Mycolicibacterium mageritense TaxID=53462 RepID=A0ABM7I119_MYCME|nr:hypothetical protein MMAGJ_58420 [Mycolicibacterium mageritense]GJJ21926.1 hypothetical protein MTY414_55990 [Mycolicibacterium mageritense]
MTDKIATGHSTDRSTVAVLGAEVRGRNAFMRALLRDPAAATSEPYTDATVAPRQAGQNVSVSGGLPLSM